MEIPQKIDKMLMKAEKRTVLKMCKWEQDAKPPYYVDISDALGKINEGLSDTLGSDIFDICGKWHGAGLENIPAVEICERVRELIREYTPET